MTVVLPQVAIHGKESNLSQHQRVKYPYHPKASLSSRCPTTHIVVWLFHYVDYRVCRAPYTTRSSVPLRANQWGHSSVQYGGEP